MLKADTEFAGIFNDLSIFRHCIRERLQRDRRSNVVGGINDHQCWNRQTGWADKPFTNLQHATAETIFAIKPFDDLMHQFAWERKPHQGPSAPLAHEFPLQAGRKYSSPHPSSVTK